MTEEWNIFDDICVFRNGGGGWQGTSFICNHWKGWNGKCLIWLSDQSFLINNFELLVDQRFIGIIWHKINVCMLCQRLFMILNTFYVFFIGADGFHVFQ